MDDEREQNGRMKKIDYEELLHKYRLLQDLMEHIPDVIYFKDKDGKLIMVNNAHAKGLGLKPEEVVGKTDFDIHPKERAEKMLEDDLYVMRTGKPIVDKMERATRSDGVDNFVSTTKIPRFDEDGNIIGLVGITRDITHRMQMERLREEKARVEEKLAAAEELNRLKSELVSIVSHELRTPLTIVKETVELVYDKAAGPLNLKQKGFLKSAKSNIERLRAIIEDLLDLSSIEKGKLKLSYDKVDLNSLIKEGAAFFKKHAGENGIRLEYVLPKRPLVVSADPKRITQVLTNLINNAIKFTEEGGSIEVKLKAHRGDVVIEVRDTGIGIAKGDIPRLFDKFAQSAAAGQAASDKKGLGLGLAISKTLVEMHGGRIWAESKPGLGSKFYFTFPRK